jgi:xanthine dehydrogenase small subunit
MSPRPDPLLPPRRRRRVDGAAPTRTVLDWLREDARCTGTKEGCNEGDCGACTVVIGELAPAGAASDDVVGGLRLRSANACIQFLPTLDGKALFTVERPAGARRSRSHPVQQAMVACHGSQCGFCTPGFVMSLWATYQHHARARHAAVAPADRRRAVGQPLPLHRLPADRRRRRAHVRPARGAARRRAVVAALTSLRDAAPLRSVGANGAEFIAPRTLDDFAAALLARPTRASSPARPTSACGSTRCSATCRACSTSARSTS